MGDSTRLGSAETQADPSGETVAESKLGGQSAPQIGTGQGPEGEPARGDAIGRFIVLGLLGSGGMGLVYSAYDPHLDRKVAIKLLRRTAFASADDARLRLLREAQAMAKIDHPNVVRVHEAGLYGEQIYVAMEFVDRGTLRAWLAAERRSTREILEVFAQAGRGLAAAHAAGLVHRDFKPDNVLMASDGGVRVTDFGIVGVIQGRAQTEQPVDAAKPRRPESELPIRDSKPLSQDLTRTGSIMGTPIYMAPEQFNGEAATAHSDQFSFCVALYEALYGERPFRGSTFAELAVSVGEGQIEPAPKQAVVPSRLRRILVRGLARAPAERFASITALLSAIDRHLHERRRRAAWIAGIAIVAVAGGLFAMRSRSDAQSCDGDAELARVWNPTVRGQLQSSFLASRRPSAATSFADVTSRLDAWGNGWKDAYTDVCRDHQHSQHVVDLRAQCVGRRLDEASATIDLLARGGSDAVDHAVDAVVRLPGVAPCADTVGLSSGVAPPDDEIAHARVRLLEAQLDEARAQAGLARYANARELARRALDGARATGYLPIIAKAQLVLAMQDIPLADNIMFDDLRAALHTAAAAGDEQLELDAAIHLLEQLALEGHHDELVLELRDLADSIAKHIHPRADAAVDLAIADALVEQVNGKLAPAQAGYEHAADLAIRTLGPTSRLLGIALDQLGELLKREGKFAQAQATLERALALREVVFGKNHPTVAAALSNLGGVLRVEAKFDDAKQLYDRALAIRLATFGPVHPDVATSYIGFGSLYGERGDHAKALESFEKALAIFEQVSAPNSEDVAIASNDVGLELMAAGRLADGRKAFERCISIYESLAGPNDPRIAEALSNLALADLSEGKYADAFAKFHHAEQIAATAYGPEHPDVGDYLINESAALMDLNRLDEATATARRAAVVVAKAYGPDHPHLAMALGVLAEIQLKHGDLASALTTNRNALAILDKHDPASPTRAALLLDIGRILDAQHTASQAVPVLEEALEVRERAQATAGHLAEVHLELASALFGTSRVRARAEAQKAVTLYTQAGQPNNAKNAKRWLARH